MGTGKANPATNPVGLDGWFDLGDVVRGTIKKIEQAVAWQVYMGHVHLIHSKPGDGKTLWAIHAAIHALKKGLKVMYLDAENGPVLMGGRFKAMGWTDFTNLKYNPSPEITLDPVQIANLLHDVDTFGPDVVFIDSLADFLALCGLNENDAGDFTRWFSEIVKPLRDRGIAVVMLDHEPWESRGHARGSTAKFAKVDAEWELRKTRHFDRNQEGEITLKLKKDRPAQLDHKTLTFTVGGPNLRFEHAEDPRPDEGFTFTTESVRHTTEAIKGFGEAGATDKEWRTATEEMGTKKSAYYNAKNAMLADGRVSRTEGGKFAYSTLLRRTLQEPTPLPPVELGEEKSRIWLGNGDYGTPLTPRGVEMEPLDIHSTYSGGSRTRSKWSNQVERVEKEQPPEEVWDWAVAEWEKDTGLDEVATAAERTRDKARKDFEKVDFREDAESFKVWKDAEREAQPVLLDLRDLGNELTGDIGQERHRGVIGELLGEIETAVYALRNEHYSVRRETSGMDSVAYQQELEEAA